MKYYSDLVNAFRQLVEEQLWDQIDDSFLIGIRSKKDSQIYWCSLMGKAKDVYGFAMYKGSKGLSVFQSILENPDSAADPELRPNQDMILFCLDPEEFLSAPQQEFIQIHESSHFSNGLYLIPSRMKPGFPESICTDDEVSLGLELLSTFVDFLKSSKKDTLELEEDALILLPEDGACIDDWREYSIESTIQPEDAEVPDDIPLLQVDMTSIEGLNLEGTIWEIHCCYAPFVVEDGPKGAYHPEMILILNKDQAQIIGHEIFEFEQLSNEKLIHKVAETIAAAGYLPCEIEVKTIKLHHLMARMLESHGVDINLVEKLPMITDCLQSMAEQFMHQHHSHEHHDCCTQGTCG